MRQGTNCRKVKLIKDATSRRMGRRGMLDAIRGEVRPGPGGSEAGAPGEVRLGPGGGEAGHRGR